MSDSAVIGCGHFGVTVDDVERTRDFFIEVLGFSAGPEVSLDPAFSSAVTGVDGAQIDACFVLGHGITVELLKYHAPGNRGRVDAHSCDTGSAHMAFYVTSIETVLNQSKSFGWRPLGVPTPITVGPRAGGKACYATNTDGVVLEFVELPAN